MRVPVAIVAPVKKTENEMGPTPVGTKNPITVEANKILEISEKYLERVSICSLFNIIIMHFHYRSSV